MSIQKRPRAKIVATVGPACDSPENLLKLARAGVSVFRLNFSHGSHDVHKTTIDRIQAINQEHQMHLSILADLQGPKLRVGEIENNALPLAAGDVITLVNEPCVGNMDKIYMSYKEFARDVTVGEKVLVDDGKLVFEVVATNGENEVKLKTLFGGVLSSNKGVNLPNTKISLPSLTEKDERDLEFILTQPAVNWIALSFVRHSKDLKDLRRRIEAKEHNAKIIAKVEKPEAIENIDKIIKHSNAIMVARGDLGIEVPMEELPVIQKMIITKCIQRARPVIVATQMMDSMITSPNPTRAEVTDVANAIMDGTDAVMLSGETSVGAHPEVVVKTMQKIMLETEKYPQMNRAVKPVPSAKSRTYISDAVCFNASKTAVDINAKGIVGMTSSGYTAFKVSSYRPNSDIYIFSDRPFMLATLNLVWGVQCFLYNQFKTTDESIEDVNNILKQEEVVKAGDILVNTGSMPIHRRHRTNMLKVTIIED